MRLWHCTTISMSVWISISICILARLIWLCVHSSLSFISDCHLILLLSNHLTIVTDEMQLYFGCTTVDKRTMTNTGFFFFMRSKNLYIFFLYLFISEHAKYTITRLINQIYFRKICWLDVKCAHAFDSQQFVSLLHFRYALYGEEMM